MKAPQVVAVSFALCAALAAADDLPLENRVRALEARSGQTSQTGGR